VVWSIDTGQSQRNELRIRYYTNRESIDLPATVDTKASAVPVVDRDSETTAA
jgi:hypothetical protein